MKEANKVAAVVLAGGSASDDLARRAGVSSKALVPISGKPMAAYVLEALRASSSLGHISYVGPSQGLEPLVDAVIPSGNRLVDSLSLGLGSALSQTPRAILVLTADIPWISSEALDRFIGEAPEADLVYPIIAKEDSAAQFPNQKRTYVKVKEGALTGGNAVLLRPKVIPQLLPFIDQLYRSRKNPLKLASLFGWDIVFKIGFGQASVVEIEARASKLLKSDVRAFLSEDASLAADVDKIEHLGSLSLSQR